MLRRCDGASIATRVKTEINCGYSMGNLLPSQRAIASAGSATALNTEIGGQVFMGKERDTFRVVAREPIFSVLTVTTPMSPNLNR